MVAQTAFSRNLPTPSRLGCYSGPFDGAKTRPSMARANEAGFFDPGAG